MGAAVSLSRISKRFRVNDGTKAVFSALNDVTLSIEKNTCTLFGGANGSGKTLLMSIIAGLEEPSSGSVLVDGKVGLIFQDADSQILGESPREDVAIGVSRAAKEKLNSIVEDALLQTGLLYKADAPARFLSGGEKRRLAVAGVLAMNADIIIFDEPYANLDYNGVLEINHLIVKLKAEQKTLIILTHEIEKCIALAERFIVLHKGSIVHDSSANDISNIDLTQWGIHNLQDVTWL